MTQQEKSGEKISSEERKKRLEELHHKKESAFEKKQKIAGTISEKIKQIGEYKKKRNAFTRQVHEVKKERDVLNDEITTRIEELKKARPKKKGELPKDDRGRPLKPQFLQRKINDLERKIETVPMNFDAEQRIMKEIKTLKKQLDQAEDAIGLSDEMMEKSKKVDELKREANRLHAKVTELAKQSQEYHEKMIALGEQIDTLKDQENQVYQEFLKYKQEYVALSGDVKEQQYEERQRKQQAKRKAQAKRRAEEEKTLKERAKEAEEKMNTGKKLTTEDLLALQSRK